MTKAKDVLIRSRGGTNTHIMHPSQFVDNMPRAHWQSIDSDVPLVHGTQAVALRCSPVHHGTTLRSAIKVSTIVNLIICVGLHVTRSGKQRLCCSGVGILPRAAAAPWSLVLRFMARADSHQGIRNERFDQTNAPSVTCDQKFDIKLYFEEA